MIKFFRKIRRKLLYKNKISKYLLYGIGEIILVVIGILIAVQLNNKNEFRKQKLVEIDILKGIRSDILLDTVDLNLNIRGYTNLIKNDSLLLDYIIKKKEVSKGLANALKYSTNSTG